MTIDTVDDIVWPQFVVPFPARVNPHRESAEAGTRRWARSIGLVTSDAAVARLEGLCAGYLAARAYPRAGRAELQVNADWLAWMFLLDDQGDESPAGRDPQGWRSLLVPFDQVLAGDRVPADCPPLARALADLLERSSAGMSATWCARLRRHVKDYVWSYHGQAVHRAQASSPSVAQYILNRRDCGATYVALDIVESGLGVEVPTELYESREYQDLVVAAADVVNWENDVSSVGKELARGDIHNLTLVIRAATGCTLQQALDRAAAMTATRIAWYIQARHLMEHLLDAGPLPPECRDQVRRCLDNYEDWMRGHVDWWAETSRYRDIVHADEGATLPYIEPILQASAARPAVGDLCVQFVGRVSADMDAARERNLDWARRHGLIDDPRDEWRYRSWDIADLMARWLPEASGPALDLGVDAVIVATLIDDQFDVTDQPEKVAAACEHLLAVLEPEPDGSFVPQGALAVAFADVWSRLCHGASRQWQSRAAENWRRYLQAYRTEADVRARGFHQTREEYLALRRDSGFVLPMLDMVEAAYGFETTVRARQMPVVRRMLTLASDIVDTVNDLYSLNKEESHGDVHNLVLVVQNERGCTRGQALAEVEACVDAWCDEYLDCEAELPAACVQHHLAAQETADVRRLAAAARDAMGGFPDWSRRSGRYTQLIPAGEAAYADDLL